MARNFSLFVLMFTTLLLAPQVDLISQCKEHAVRLLGGSNDNEGTVEVCVGGEWGTVCNDTWDSSDAIVVCRHVLGYYAEGSIATSRSYSSRENCTIFMNCNGMEESVFDCEFDSLYQRNHTEGASVICAALDPLVPTLLQAERISASQIRISWEPNSRNSPLTNYTVKYYPLSQDTHLQESLLTTTEREVVVWDLEPGLRYSVSVAANNAAGRGTYTEEVTVELFENSFFQVFLSGDIVCVEWMMNHIDSKLQSLSARLAENLNRKCRCDFNSKYIVFNHSLCLNDNSDWFVTSGLLIGTNISNSSDMIEFLQMWVEAESQVVVEGVLLTAVKNCSVYLEEGEPIVCNRLRDPSISVCLTAVQGSSTALQETSVPVQRNSIPLQKISTPVQGTSSIQGSISVQVLCTPVHKTSTPSQGTESTPVEGLFPSILFVLFPIVPLILAGPLLLLWFLAVHFIKRKAQKQHSKHSQGKPLSASYVQALEKSSVGTKDVDGCEDTYNSADGSSINENIIDSDSPHYPPSDQQSMPKSPAVCVDLNAYETVPEQSVKNALLPHIINQESPLECTTLQHIQTGTPGSQGACGNSPAQYRQLMFGSETPAYTLLQEVQKSEISIAHKEGETLRDDQDSG